MIPRTWLEPIKRHPVSCLALLVVIVGVVIRILYPDSIYFNIHAERDTWRTIQMLQGDRFYHTGSELTKGGYTPGPALYFLQTPPLLVTLDPRGLLVWLALLHGLALWLTYRIGDEHFSPMTGLAAAALFATFPVAALAVRYLWNPSYLFPFVVLFYWALMDWCFRRTPRRLPWLAVSLAVMIQLHISALMLVLLTILCAAIYRPPLTRRTGITAAAAAFLVFSPYVAGELATGFSNTRLMASPPEALATANGAIIPIRDRERVMINVGAMKALQVALSPVFYDRRYETGSFSYLALLAEYGPYHLTRSAWEFVFRLHQLRWMYVGLYVVFWAMALVALLSVRLRWLFASAREGVENDNPRGKALFFALAAGGTILPPLFAATMVAPLDDGKVGVGAVRYYFVFYPLPFLMLALLGRGAGKALRRWLGWRGILIPAAAVTFLSCLQAATLLAHYRTASEMRRSFKYSLHEAYDWSVQREAADVLVNRWGISPVQFRHHFVTLDHTFDSTRWDVPSLEMGLDYAYFTHPDLDMSAPAKHERAFVYIYDELRTEEPSLEDINVLDKVNVGGLVMILSDDGPWSQHSPIQNTWELLTRPKRLTK